jgi:hypothetical protein
MPDINEGMPTGRDCERSTESNGFYMAVQRRISELEDIIKRAKIFLEYAPQETVYICKCGKYYRYYIVKFDYGKKSRNYLKKDDPILPQLVQKKYCLEIIKAAEAELNKLTQIQTEIHTPEMVRLEYQEELGDMIVPLTESAEDYIARWREHAKKAEVMDFHPEQKKYRTKQGGYVRSKSELIIANALTDHGVPYIYEKRRVLRDGNVVFPDFTIPAAQNRGEIIIEHFGMMNDDGYREDALNKINKYMRNGFIFGRNLVVFFESDNVPIDLAVVNEQICGLLDHLSAA